MWIPGDKYPIQMEEDALNENFKSRKKASGFRYYYLFYRVIEKYFKLSVYIFIVKNAIKQ